MFQSWLIVPVFEQKEEDVEVNVSRASSLSALLPTSIWEVFFQQAIIN